MTGVWDDSQSLLPDVLVCVPGAAKRGRLEASYGTVPATLADGDYDAGAIIPTCEWHALTNSGRETLCHASPKPRMDTTIRIVTLSSAILEPFRELRELSHHCSLDELRRQISRPVYADPIQTCAKYVRDHFGICITDTPEQVAGGIRVDPGNLRTVTINPATSRRVGMHVDSWTCLSLSQRHIAPPRICINLGNDARYFLFVNLSVGRLIADSRIDASQKARPPLGGSPSQRDALGEFGELVRTANGTGAARAFMTCSPRYPVIRLRVYPGEAYIAPTENIIHDGSSIGARHDVSLSLRGSLRGSYRTCH